MTQVINIQKFSIHDGDGIRTTVFFKGCPLACAWCHNPESQRYQAELLFHQEKCIGCGACLSVCPSDSILADFIPNRLTCTACGSCTHVCAAMARAVAGRYYTPRELVKELLKDQQFYEESGGGVTLSGGEVLAQDIDYILQVIRPLKRQGIHIAIDTCGYIPYENIEKVLPYVDLFLYDIKGLQTQLHEKFTGKSNTLILENLRKLAKTGKDIYLRVPLMKEVNCSKAELEALLLLALEVRPKQLNLLPYHNIGNAKNQRLQRDYISFTAPTEEELINIQQTFIAAGIDTKIGG